MNLEDIKDFFGTYKNAMQKAGLSQNAYLHWRRDGRIPPKAQEKIAQASRGFLKAEKGINKYAQAKKGFKPVAAIAAKKRYARERARNAQGVFA